MPEGPQVKRLGSMIASFAWVDITKITYPPGSKRNLQLTPPFQITKVAVKGKNIFVYLNNGQVLHNHMLMWGKWCEGCEPNCGKKRLSVCFSTLNGDFGYYGGGVLKLVTPEQAETMRAALGPDMITTTEEAKAFARLKESAKPIGEALLAQELVSGIGNIYKSEGLFIARLNPWRAADSLSKTERQKLFTFLHTQMVKDVTYPGIVTTTPELLEQGYRRYAYKRWHQPCLVCGTRIERDYQGSNLKRSTYFCPHCQHVE